VWGLELCGVVASRCVERAKPLKPLGHIFNFPTLRTRLLP
jgi:hypothetical protein